MQNKLISQLKRRELTTSEKEILSTNFSINLFEEMVESTKIRYESKVFHSKQNNRKINSNSYTISFKINNEIEYGEILYFFEHKNTIFAKINVFLKLINEVLPEKISGFFYDTFEKLYSDFYGMVDVGADKSREDIIMVEQIKFKCILINYKNNLFYITNLVYEYEHD